MSLGMSSDPGRRRSRPGARRGDRPPARRDALDAAALALELDVAVRAHPVEGGAIDDASLNGSHASASESLSAWEGLGRRRQAAGERRELVLVGAAVPGRRPERRVSLANVVPRPAQNHAGMHLEV